VSAAAPAPTEKWCALECECGAKGGQYVRHYDLVSCSCGRMYWALQAKRDGPYELVLWPGSYHVPPPAINGLKWQNPRRMPA
jgi:hypothetical protein